MITGRTGRTEPVRSSQLEPAIIEAKQVLESAALANAHELHQEPGIVAAWPAAIAAEVCVLAHTSGSGVVPITAIFIGAQELFGSLNFSSTNFASWFTSPRATRSDTFMVALG